MKEHGKVRWLLYCLINTKFDHRLSDQEPLPERRRHVRLRALPLRAEGVQGMPYCATIDHGSLTVNLPSQYYTVIFGVSRGMRSRQRVSVDLLTSCFSSRLPDANRMGSRSRASD